MAIPESQLETWTHIGAGPQSAATYQSIKAVIEHKDAPYVSRQVDSFLQGSYGNDTNVYGADSDVDIVLRTKAFFHYDLDALPEQQKEEFKRVHPTPSAYNLTNFKADVSTWLNQKYSNDLDTSGKKALRIRGNANRRDTDVLLVAPHKRYTRYFSEQDNECLEGVLFITSDGKSIINYPKQHAENMTRKHQASNSWLKPTVRIYKNMRNRMVDKGLVGASTAPSYFIEGLLHNVPSSQFGESHAKTVEQTFDWISDNSPDGFRCANGVHPLIFDGATTSWPVQGYIDWINGMKKLWNSW